MKKTILLLAAVLSVAGCATHYRTIKFESEPPGMRVFMVSGETRKKAGGRNYLGQTPFEWTSRVRKDGTFITPNGEIPYYSDYVPGVVIFTAEPVGSQTNLFKRQEIFRSNANYQPGNQAPDGVFFDCTKPEELPDPKLKRR